MVLSKQCNLTNDAHLIKASVEGNVAPFALPIYGMDQYVLKPRMKKGNNIGDFCRIMDRGERKQFLEGLILVFSKVRSAENGFKCFYSKKLLYNYKFIITFKVQLQ